jgi:hypothetical protein
VYSPSGRPFTTIAPVCGSRRRRSSCTSVDLPEPDGPTMPMASPRAMSKDTFATAGRAPGA